MDRDFTTDRPPPGDRAGREARLKWVRISLFPGLALGALVLGHGVGNLLRMWPECRFHRWTGWDCPGCGGTRAFLALTRGELGKAWVLNPFGVLLILGVALLSFKVSWDAAFPHRKLPAIPFGGRLALGLAFALIAFSVLRNLPWWPVPLPAE